ncbi:MAG: fumarate lyase [Spirochaetales bacterium]|nr:fumarate lyase [Spirochaetales bacterium]
MTQIHSDFKGSETFKALQNWGVGATPPCLVKAYAQVKKAALLAANEVNPSISELIFNKTIRVIDQIINGEFNHLFKLPLKQGGAGTSLNMNMNEVIAHIVNAELGDNSVNYLDDINRYQSTNDTFNTAVTIIFLTHLDFIEKMVIELQEILVEKEGAYSGILITGRTEMQSALPMTLGQVFSSYAGSIERDRWRFSKVKERVRSSVLGGTALGTCFSAPSKYLFAAERHLRKITGLSLPRSQNLVSDISMCDKFVEAASVYNALANSLFKISSDFILYVFTGEIEHPHMQYGSTIMPMKINPVLLEFVKGLSIDISFETGKINEFSKNGQLQLNPFLPFILESEISIFESLKKSLNSLIYFIQHGKINRDVINNNLLKSGAIVNSLRPYCSYSKLKEVSEEVNRENPETHSHLLEIINRITDLSMDFLEDYTKPGGFTSFLKDNL